MHSQSPPTHQPTFTPRSPSWINMTANATADVSACVAACCNDTRCQAFSFNKPTPGKTPGCNAGDTCCILKDAQPPTQANGCPTCRTGTVPVPPPPVSPTNDTCGPAPLNAGCGISYGRAESIVGPFEFQYLKVVDQARSKIFDCAHTNPSPYIYPNGSLAMAINAGFCHSQLETIGILQAPAWDGPYTLRTTEGIFQDGAHSSEDPFLWVDRRGWHMLAHNFGSSISLYASSLDGVSWSISPDAPYTTAVPQTGGLPDLSCNVQRPQLVFHADGSPRAIVNGAQCDATGSQQFTMIRNIVP